MYTKAERDEALSVLRDGWAQIKPGQHLYCVVKHVSRSGMARSIAVLLEDGGVIKNVSWLVSRALGWGFDSQRDAVKVSGAGMDMCFHTVYSLGRTLFPNGGSLEHSCAVRQRQEASKKRETDGGYLLHAHTL